MEVYILLLVAIVENVYDCTTASEPPPVILAARTRSIEAVSTSTRRKIPVVGNLVNAVDVDYDYEDKQLFYTDTRKCQISR